MVLGSNPNELIIILNWALLAQLEERLFCNQQVVGSSPTQGKLNLHKG